jgi:hypothetical protein
MPIRFGDIRDNAAARFRIRGNPDVQAGDVREHAQLDVDIDSVSATTSGTSLGVSNTTAIQLFVSYRREDASGYAGRLHRDLVGMLPNATIFMDIESIRGGADFGRAIEEHVTNADVVLVIIGRRWATAMDHQKRLRLHTPDDFVRREVQTALEHKRRTIPVLVQGAQLPEQDDLPTGLQALLKRQAVELSDSRWAYDVERVPRQNWRSAFVNHCRERLPTNHCVTHRKVLRGCRDEHDSLEPTRGAHERPLRADT